MYDALKPTDEAEIRAMMRSGYTQHDAVLSLFQRSRGQYTGSRSDDDNYDQSETSSVLSRVMIDDGSVTRRFSRMLNLVRGNAII